MRVSAIFLLPLIVAAGVHANQPSSAADCDNAAAPLESDSYDVEYSTVLDPSLGVGGGMGFGAHIADRSASDPTAMSGSSSHAGADSAYTTLPGGFSITSNHFAAIMGLFVGVCLFVGAATMRARSAHRQRLATFESNGKMLGGPRRALQTHITRARMNTWHAGDLTKLNLDRV